VNTAAPVVMGPIKIKIKQNEGRKSGDAEIVCKN
jgi:hypothetical protein